MWWEIWLTTWYLLVSENRSENRSEMESDDTPWYIIRLVIQHRICYPICHILSVFSLTSSDSCIFGYDVLNSWYQGFFSWACSKNRCWRPWKFFHQTWSLQSLRFTVPEVNWSSERLGDLILHEDKWTLINQSTCFVFFELETKCQHMSTWNPNMSRPLLMRMNQRNSNPNLLELKLRMAWQGLQDMFQQKGPCCHRRTLQFLQPAQPQSTSTLDKGAGDAKNAAVIRVIHMYNHGMLTS